MAAGEARAAMEKKKKNRRSRSGQRGGFERGGVFSRRTNSVFRK